MGYRNKCKDPRSIVTRHRPMGLDPLHGEEGNKTRTLGTTRFGIDLVLEADEVGRSHNDAEIGRCTRKSPRAILSNSSGRPMWTH